MSYSNNNSNSTSGGIGFFGFLAISFIILKLLGVIEWSWLWVLSPIWLPTAFVLVVFLIMLTVHLIKNKRRNRR